ncbi:hypothetical protein K2X92_05775 [Candidatus Gracilibacteria bacterium]|nr:hypothetical protein [Candidatus Gracilibacteria bacterium]
MILTPVIFADASNHIGGVQAGILAALNAFLDKVPAGETVDIPPETSIVLTHLCSASGNDVASKVSTFNQQQVKKHPVPA